MKHTERTAVVTAASQGIGKAIARTMAREGANLAICARGRNKLVQTAQEIESDFDVHCEPITCDLTKPAELEAFANAVDERLNPIDILINNSGGPPPGGLETANDADWQSAINLKLLGYIRSTRQFKSHLKRTAGNVVNINGIAGVYPSPRILPSVGVHAANIAIIRSLAAELGPQGIRVNGVNPGFTRTPRMESVSEDLSDHRSPDEIERKVSDWAAIGRFGEPDEIASVVSFLASDEASYVTGQSINVDGGIQTTDLR